MTTGSEQYPLYDPVSGSKETMPGDNYTMPYYPATGGATPPSGGGFNPMDYIRANGPFDWQTLGGSIDPYLAQRLALIGGAWNSYDNAGKYMDTANSWAERSDPFGQFRKYYGDKLKSSYDDPVAFLNDPEHQAIQGRQMNILQGRTRAGGYMGSGKEMMDLSDYLAQSDAQYLTQQREMLGKMAGMGLSPADAARIAMQGQDQSIKAKDAALGQIVQAITPVPRNSPTGSGGGYGGMTGQQAAATVSQLIRSNPQLGRIDPRTGISFAEGVTRGYYGDQGGSGGYGGGGTGIDPTNPVDYNIMNQGGYGPMTGGGGYEGGGTDGGFDYTSESYWKNYFDGMFGEDH